jgi:hypothetical protein
VTTSIDRQIAKELAVRESQLPGMLDDVATVRFIARYRKEVTAWSTTRYCAPSMNACGIAGGTAHHILNSIREQDKRRRASSTPKSRSPMRPPRSTALVRSWSNAKLRKLLALPQAEDVAITSRL